jgi:hypothetical protein
MLGIVIASHPVREEYLQESIDSCNRVIDKVGGKLVVVRKEQSLGKNVNDGIKELLEDENIKYIKFFANDDILLESSINVLNDLIKNDTDFIHSNAIYKNFKTGSIDNYIPDVKILNFKELSYKNSISGASTFYKRSVFENELFDETLTTVEEYEFHIRLLYKNYTLSYSDNYSYIYRMHDKQKSASSNRSWRVPVIKNIKNKYTKMIISYIFSYEREEMLNKIIDEHISANIDFIIVDDGSSFINNEYYNKFNILKYNHTGKKGFIDKFNDVFNHFLKSEYSNIICIQDDCNNINFEYIKDMSIRNDDDYIFSIITDYRKKCWTEKDPIYLGNNIEQVFFVDTLFLSNKQTIEKIGKLKLNDNWFNKENISSGVGHILTKKCEKYNIPIYRRITSLITHGIHESKMHSKERIKNPLISINNIYVITSSNNPYLDKIKNQNISCKIIFEENLNVSEFIPDNSLIIRLNSEHIIKDSNDIYDIYKNITSSDDVYISRVKYPIICNIATMSSRKESLKETLESLNNQTIKPDVINIYDNDKEDIDYSDNSKFIFLKDYTYPVYYFSMDDDIIYGTDYIEKTINSIEKYNCIITYHGRILNNRFVNYYRDHKGYRCDTLYNMKSYIDVAGTGVTAFRTDYFNPVDLYKTEYKRMSDVVFSYIAKQEGKEILLISNEEKPGLILSKIKQTDSCYSSELNNTINQNKLCKKIFNLKK